eukprot:TRINITY_DN1952_c1_g3_i2.p1 TRINITY_DN1952_c1_g3~~TRINITY_DN1952_c1_g3_i2.p1  ORF type:complete len:595 (+),score=103.45 TRINITY_DN1952_c1_g3_i2:140-1786(+)
MGRGGTGVVADSGRSTGADAAVRTLVESGVTVMFANPGTTEMPVVESLDRVGGMRAVLCLHENTATGAADGYARMAGKPACTLLHLGVGLSNGIANLHNARRAGSPIVNIVGDMATWHQGADALLSMDIAGLAETVSCCVCAPCTSDDVARDTAKCVAASSDFRAGSSRVSTLILAHDCEREEVTSADDEVAAPVAEHSGSAPAFDRSAAVEQSVHCSHDAASAAVDAVRKFGAKVCVLVGGGAAMSDGLKQAARICKQTGAALFCENAFARVDRGAGLPEVQRLPYFPAEAKRALAPFEAVVCVGARVPVAMFGYEDGVSEVVCAEKQQIVTVDTHDPAGALKHIASELGAPEYEIPRAAAVPQPPKGRLTPQTLSQAIAAVQPEGAIIVDESLTSGGSYWSMSRGCPEFTHMTLTGGAIGSGPPMAAGCALACPDRRVINFQADGSGLYSTQALWTQQREGLNVTTVICNNSKYQILKIEQEKQKLDQRGAAARSLTDLGTPAIDWVALAKGYGVSAERVQTAAELTDALKRSFSRSGPFLIEAVL